MDKEKTFEKTVKWYKAFYEKNEILTKVDLETYIAIDAKENIAWTIQ